MALNLLQSRAENARRIFRGVFFILFFGAKTPEGKMTAIRRFSWGELLPVVGGDGILTLWDRLLKSFHSIGGEESMETTNPESSVE